MRVSRIPVTIGPPVPKRLAGKLDEFLALTLPDKRKII
jgi:hypothetical protein